MTKCSECDMAELNPTGDCPVCSVKSINEKIDSEQSKRGGTGKRPPA